MPRHDRSHHAAIRALVLALLVVAAAPASSLAQSPSGSGLAATASWNLSELREEAKALSPSALPDMRARASAGDARSQFVLGLAYEYGHAGLTQDLREALRWFTLAAQQSIGLPQAWVGDFYYRGIGVPVDYAEGMRWYRRSADAGYIFGAYMLGLGHVFGDGLTVDHRAASRWFKRASDGGFKRVPPWSVELLESACHDDFCIALRQLVVAGWHEKFKRFRGPEVRGEEAMWEGTRMLPGADRCRTFDRVWGTFYECSYSSTAEDWPDRFAGLERSVRAAVPPAWPAEARPYVVWRIFSVRPSPEAAFEVEIKARRGGGGVLHSITISFHR